MFPRLLSFTVEMPRVLFIGDIVGRPGRDAVAKLVPALREVHGIDIVIANGENAAAGSGITAVLAGELFKAGVDAITLGDHVWDQRGFPQEIGRLEGLCRPANLPSGVPGRPYLIVEHEGFRLGVFTLLGRHFMKISAECPFRCADALLEELEGKVDAIFVELHAETTSEKTALGWYLDGRVAMAIGTHTHIPTADGRVLPRGTAYQTDAGMTGPYASCLGRDVQSVLGRFLDGMPRRFDIAQDDVRLCGCLVEIDPEEGLATAFERIEVPFIEAVEEASVQGTEGSSSEG